MREGRWGVRGKRIGFLGFFCSCWRFSDGVGGAFDDACRRVDLIPKY